MCIAFFGLNPTDDLSFVLAFGRDEFLNRPTQETYLWPDQLEAGILGGRDLQAGGTWLAASTATGRVAFLTNLAEHDPDPGEGPSSTTHASRGELVTGFLTGHLSPEQYIRGIHKGSYHGFNLVVVDLKTGEMAYGANPLPRRTLRTTAGQAVAAGSPSIGTSTVTGMAEAGSVEARAVAGEAPASCGDVAPQTSPESDPPDEALDASMVPSQLRDNMPLHQDPDLDLIWDGPIVLKNGQIYGLSNALLGQWSKVQTGVEDLRNLLCHHQLGAAAGASSQGSTEALGLQALPWEAVFENVLGDRTRDESLKPVAFDASTSIDHAKGYICSSRFIDPVRHPKCGTYGTRSQTVMAVLKDGSAELRERSLCPDTMQWKCTAVHSFNI